jgi:hypothetical protein
MRGGRARSESRENEGEGEINGENEEDEGRALRQVAAAALHSLQLLQGPHKEPLVRQSVTAARREVVHRCARKLLRRAARKEETAKKDGSKVVEKHFAYDRFGLDLRDSRDKMAISRAKSKLLKELFNPAEGPLDSSDDDDDDTPALPPSDVNACGEAIGGGGLIGMPESASCPGRKRKAAAGEGVDEKDLYGGHGCTFTAWTELRRQMREELGSLAASERWKGVGAEPYNVP